MHSFVEAASLMPVGVEPGTLHHHAMSSRRHRQAFAWLAILALSLRMLVGAFCHPLSMPSSAQTVDDLLAQVVMCTSHGPQSSIDPAKPGPETPPPTADHCPACALVKALALVALVALLLALMLVGARQSSAWVRAAGELLPDHLRHGSNRSRAPPLPA